MPSEVCAHSVIATLESARVSSSTAIAYWSVVPPGAADRLRERDPHPSQLRHLRDDLVRERLGPIQLAGDGCDLGRGELAHRALQQLGVVVEVEQHASDYTDRAFGLRMPVRIIDTCSAYT